MVAFSVSAAGAGMGTLVMPLFVKWATEEFSWRGGYLLTAGMGRQL